MNLRENEYINIENLYKSLILKTIFNPFKKNSIVIKQNTGHSTKL